MTKKRVVVVDDDEGVRELLSKALATVFDVVATDNGARAIELIDAGTACVVADHMMPGMTGIDVLERVRGTHALCGRVLVTASERVSDLLDAVNRAQVHRFLSKPVRIAELLNAVGDAIRTASLEHENERLVVELKDKNALLQKALSHVQESERRLERTVADRTKELRAANEELQRLALRDGLTGLYNHRFFQEAMTQEIARAARYQTPVGLVFLDVDHFKNYNDMLGHPAGDQLLREIANVLVATEDNPEVRFRGRASDITARYGGEEFCVILPVTDQEGALIRAERIRLQIAEFAFTRRDVQPSGIVSASIGVASFPENAVEKAGLIEAADAALLVAKRAGRNRVAGAPKIITTTE